MIRINLLKPERKEVREAPAVPSEELKVKKRFPFPILIVLLCFAVIIVLFFLQKSAIEREKDLLRKAQEEKRELQYVLAKLEELERQKSLFEKKINLIKNLKAQQEVPVRVMSELSKSIPDWVWLTEVKYSGQTIRIKGRAQSNNLIADYIYNLERSPYLSSVDLVSSNQKTSRGDQYLEFSLTARYVLQTESELSPQQSPKKEKK